MIKISIDHWKVTSDPPPLKHGEVHLWRVDLDFDSASINSHFELLSVDEKARADKYVFARDRQHFVAARGTLRKIIGGYLGKPPEKVRFSVRQYGKPDLSAEDRDLRFNVSHSNGIAVIAVSLSREVGVDIEFVDRTIDVFSVAHRVFSTAEVSRMRSLPLNLQTATFFAGWTRKEAFLKAIGDGLSSSEEIHESVSLISDEGVSHRLLVNNKITDWSQAAFEVHNDFKASLVVEGNLGTVRYWQMSENHN